MDKHPRKTVLRKKREPRLCCEPNCGRVYFCFGRCKTCFREMDSYLYARLKSMSRAERQAEFQKATSQPERPRWTYEGDEAALIAENQKGEQHHE